MLQNLPFHLFFACNDTRVDAHQTSYKLQSNMASRICHRTPPSLLLIACSSPNTLVALSAIRFESSIQSRIDLKKKTTGFLFFRRLDNFVTIVTLETAAVKRVVVLQL